MTPQKQDRAAMKRELARLLAQMEAEDGEENPPPYVFTNNDIIILPASVEMEVRVRMRHKNKTLFPQFDLAGVVGYVTE
jgi:hypothetical protein